jgi:hypothetical protein
LAVGVHGPDDALGGIFVVDRESLELRPLTGRDDLLEGASSPDRDPVWSPDGSHIAFTREVVIPHEGSRLSTEQIFVMRADGEEQRPLTSPEAISYPYDIVWRPDGQALTILAAPDDTRGNGDDSLLFDARLSGSATSELMDCTNRAPDTPCPSSDLAWSPDGTELAFRADGFVGDDDPVGFYFMTPGVLPHSFSGDLLIGADTAVACCFAWQGLREPGDLHDDSSPDPDHQPTKLTIELGQPIEIGDYANAIAIGEGSVWVAAHSLDEENLEVVRLDPGTSEVVVQLPVSALPGWAVGGGGLAVGRGSVWVAAGKHRDVTLIRIDPSTNEVLESLSLGPGSGADVWVDESGIWVLAFGREQNEVIRLDPSTHAIVARIALPASWVHQIVASNGSIWVHGNAPDAQGDNVVPNTIYRIDPTTNELIDSYGLPSTDFPLAADALAMWQRTSTGVARVDPAGRGIEADLEMPSNACCDHIAADGQGGVWMIGWVGEDRLGAWHVTPEGVIDHTGAIEVPREAGGIAAVLDLETMTFWTAQYRDSVTPIRIRSDQSIGS